ncbi:MAG: multiple sugar transport system permease protein [Thermotogaceae bacterium]|nr:multiple sugar transport system permease protein [Thermotogaceae bacterium]MDN5337611.1 multiple sugar transport system permease protein [Thermotogaceae bacterium]
MMKRKILRYIRIATMWLVALIWILPFVGVFMTAIRPMEEILDGWWNFEKFNLTFENFSKALTHPTASLAQGTKNSLIVAIPATVIPLLIATMAGYGFSRYKFPSKKLTFILIIITLALPQQMIAVPVFQLLNAFGLVDRYLGLILIHSAWGIPWITFFMRNFFSTIPANIEEAARIDGASDFLVFFRIIFPLALPGIASAAALQFTWVWSDFFLALISVYSPEKLLATQRIPLMRGVYHVDWGLLAAGAILVLVVPLTVYVILQKQYVKGMVGWSLK